MKVKEAELRELARTAGLVIMGIESSVIRVDPRDYTRQPYPQDSKLILTNPSLRIKESYEFDLHKVVPLSFHCDEGRDFVDGTRAYQSLIGEMDDLLNLWDGKEILKRGYSLKELFGNRDAMFLWGRNSIVMRMPEEVLFVPFIDWNTRTIKWRNITFSPVLCREECAWKYHG